MRSVQVRFETLDSEFNIRNRRNPIHSINTRLKSNSSIMEKLVRKELPPTLENIEGHIQDIAGVSAPFKNVIFCRNKMSFFAGQHTSVYGLNYRPTYRLEARQVLIYQCILDLTGENYKYNYSMAVHFYPPFSYILCSAKNYKIASAATAKITEYKLGPT